MIAQGTPKSIKSALGDVVVYTFKQSYAPEVTAAIKGVAGVILTNQFGDDLHIVTEAYVQKGALEEVISRVAGRPVVLQETEPDLEDVFIALTQGDER